MNSKISTFITILICSQLCSISFGHAATTAGTIETLKGKAWIVDAQDQRRQIEKGGTVEEGETISTGKKSAISIRFEDKTFFALGETSQMEVTRFTYEKENKDNSILTRVVRGSFRFISGLISKSDRKAMNVKTGVIASIGIRGTHVAGEVIPRKVSKDGKVISEESAKIVLLKPETGNEKTSIEVSNNYGSTVIDEHGFGTEIPDEHSPPSPPRKIQIRTINKINRALRSPTKVPSAIRR